MRLSEQEADLSRKFPRKVIDFCLVMIMMLIFDELTSMDLEAMAEVMILSIKDCIVIVITHNQGRALLDRFDDCLEL